MSEEQKFACATEDLVGHAELTTMAGRDVREPHWMASFANDGRGPPSADELESKKREMETVEHGGAARTAKNSPLLTLDLSWSYVSSLSTSSPCSMSKSTH